MKKFFAIAALLCASVFAFAQEQQATPADYGYKQTGFMSTPKVGAYIIGSYKYSDKEGANDGPGFGCRLIRAYVDGDWVTADGTTLGADNGIGCATAMAVLADKELKHLIGEIFA